MKELKENKIKLEKGLNSKLASIDSISTQNELSKVLKDIALLEIGFVGFDYQRKMPGRLPQPFLDKLKSLMDG